MVKLNKNRSENFLAFVSTRATFGSRPIYIVLSESVSVIRCNHVVSTAHHILYIVLSESVSAISCNAVVSTAHHTLYIVLSESVSTSLLVCNDIRAKIYLDKFSTNAGPTFDN